MSVVASFHIDSRDVDMSLQSGTPSNFILSYKVPIALPNGRNYEIAVARSMLFYAWNNFERGVALVNTIFDYNGTVLDIPSGNYSLSSLEAKIKETLTDNGFVAANFTMKKDYPSGKIIICVLGGDTMIPLRADFAQMIGFPIAVPIVGCVYADFLPNFEGDNTQLYIGLDNIDGNRSFINKDNIPHVYPIRPPDTVAYTQFNAVDTLGQLIFFPLSSPQILEFRVKIINQKDEVVDLNGTYTKFWFIIRERLPSNEVVVMNFKEMRVAT